MIVIETNSLYAGRIFNDVFNILVHFNTVLNVVGAERLFKYKSVVLGNVKIVHVVNGITKESLSDKSRVLMLTGQTDIKALRMVEHFEGHPKVYSLVCLQYTDRKLTNQEELLQSWWNEVKTSNQINQSNF